MVSRWNFKKQPTKRAQYKNNWLEILREDSLDPQGVLTKFWCRSDSDFSIGTSQFGSQLDKVLPPDPTSSLGGTCLANLGKFGKFYKEEFINCVESADDQQVPPLSVSWARAWTKKANCIVLTHFDRANFFNRGPFRY